MLRGSGGRAYNAGRTPAALRLCALVGLQGTLPPGVLDLVVRKRGGKRAAVEAMLKAQMAPLRARVTRLLQELEAKSEEERQRLRWVCQFCGNSNPDCPYRKLQEVRIPCV